jgi:hypothetical protein
MHASNEQGALWNDINRTGLQGTQITTHRDQVREQPQVLVSARCRAGNKFAPIQLSHGGMILHAAGGGSLHSAATGGSLPTPSIGNPEAIDVDTPEVKKQKQASYGSQPFEFKWPSTGGGGDNATAGRRR